MTPELCPSDQLNLAAMRELVDRMNPGPSIPPEGVESCTPNAVVAGPLYLRNENGPVGEVQPGRLSAATYTQPISC